MTEEIKNASNPKREDADVETNKLVAALSYLWILCLVPLLLKKDSKFAQHHAKQGLVLFIAEILVSFINIIPFLGQLVWFFAAILFLVLSVIGIIKTLNGEWWKAPYIYDWSKKVNL